MLIRRGSSLVELVVALALAAVLLGAATGSMLRQQRTTTRMANAARDGNQLRAAVALLPAYLALLTPSSGDLVAGGMMDTALQFRAVVGTGVACDSAAAPAFALDEDGQAMSGVAAAPRPGDSLWWYRADSSRWTGRLVFDAWSESVLCPAASSAPALHHVLRMRTGNIESIPALSPLRITRQVRLVVYGSGDGSWQLGVREWSEVMKSLAGPQPVAGPFQRIGLDGARTGFRYFDLAGAELLPPGNSATRARVARVRFTALSIARPAAGSTSPPPRDSVDVLFQPIDVAP